MDSIRDVWTVLQKASAGPTVFQSWTWSRIWCEHVLAARRDMRLAVRLVEDGAGRPLAILPFYEQSLVSSHFSVTQFLVHRIVTYNDILLIDPTSEELADEVVHLLLAEPRGWTFIHLRQLRGESSFASRLLARGLAEQQCERGWIDLQEPIADATARLGSERRKKLRQAARRLRNAGVVQYDVCQRGELRAAFDKLIDLHHRRFRHKHDRSVLTDRNVTFLRCAVERLGAQDKAEILQIRHNDVIIAAMLSNVDQSTYFPLASGWDPAFARYSPGSLLLATAIQRASVDLGCHRLEFGPMYDAYKYHWNATVGASYFANLGGRRWVSRFAARMHARAFRRRAVTHDER